MASCESSYTSCESCTYTYYDAIARFYNNDTEAHEFLRGHGILPQQVSCPKCDRPCSPGNLQALWRCTGSFVLPKKKKRRFCGFTVSDKTGTFLEKTRVPAWKIVLFANIFLNHSWSHKTVIHNLDLTRSTSIHWMLLCCGITEEWLKSQTPIGGVGVEVEIDETLLVRRKYNKRVLKQIWLFGGIERVSKRRFIVPLSEAEDRTNEETLIPLIKKYILPGSIIYSDSWKEENNIEHYTINPSEDFESFVNPQDQEIHTENIELLWRDVKKWVKKPGMRAIYLRQYLSRYLFIKSQKDEPDMILHNFFMEVSKMYPHPYAQK